MRIRKSASRLLGSVYSASAARPLDAAPPPAFDLLTLPPHLAPCSATESHGGSDFSSPAAASGELCELSRSPWDLIAELSLSDPQVEDDLVDRYFVHVATRASWLFSATMPATSTKKKKLAAAGQFSKQLQREVLKKAAINNEVGKAKKKANVKKEEGQLDGGAQVWKCKKNDGKRWHCHRTVTQPDALCDYHFVQQRSYSNPNFEFPSSVELEETMPVTAAPPKPSTSSNKPRKKKKPGSGFNATEGFYYYAGFGPFQTKRQCRNGGMNEPLPPKQEEKEEQPREASTPCQAEVDLDDNNQTAALGDVSSCDDDIAAIAGVDEESSDEDFDGLRISGQGIDGGDPQAINGDGKRKSRQWKRWRKPVKARSLKSLM